MAGLVSGQKHMRADEDRRAAGSGELHVIFGLGHRIMGDGLQPVGCDIRAGEDTEHTGHRQRRRLVDSHDPGMRVG